MAEKNLVIPILFQKIKQEISKVMAFKQERKVLRKKK